MASVSVPNARVVARVPEQIRQTIQMAADLTGAPLNQFLVQTAYKEARQILDRETLIRLSEAQSKQVFDLLNKPPSLSSKLSQAADIFRANVRV